MKSIKVFLLIASSVFWVMSLHAQQGVTKIELSYSAGFPAGSFKQNLISDPSYRGMDLRIMHGINDKFSVGFGTGFQDFYQKYPRDVYKLNEGGEVSAVLTNSIQTIPILAEFQ